MQKNVPWTDLKGSSKLFLDYINNESNNSLDGLSEKIKEIADTNYQRSILINTIVESSKNYDLSSSQLKNLDLLSGKNTLAVVTGQQACFLGGSLFTLLKALDTIKISKELKLKYPDFNFVPIFWIEDNDDDLAEASAAYLFNDGYELKDFKLHFNEQSIVAKTYIQDKDLEIISQIKEILTKLPFSEKYIEIIDRSYFKDHTWSDCFALILNNLLGNEGLLTISASKLIETGVYKNLVIEELSNPSRSYESIERSNYELTSSGYHLQAVASSVNLFFVSENRRHKIEFDGSHYTFASNKISLNSIKNFVEDNCRFYTPKVLLRPVFQDYAMPTIVYSAGPAELAYHQQIKNLYTDFNIIKPKIIARTSVTVVDKKIQRYLTKINREPEYFQKDLKDIFHEITDELLGTNHELIINQFKENFGGLFEGLEKYLMTIDNQLDRSINNSYQKIIEQIDHLDKKAHSSAKRSNDELIQKYTISSNSLFPASHYQERVINTLFFLSQSDDLINKILDIPIEEKSNHIFLYL